LVILRGKYLNIWKKRKNLADYNSLLFLSSRLSDVGGDFTGVRGDIGKEEERSAGNCRHPGHTVSVVIDAFGRTGGDGFLGAILFAGRPFLDIGLFGIIVEIKRLRAYFHTAFATDALIFINS